MTATVLKMYAGDKDAIKIGKRIAAAKESMVDSVKNLIEAGLILIEKKEALGHGNWLPWVKENEDVLGFTVQKNECATAGRLMKLAKSNPALAQDLTEAEASQISKRVWGHTNVKPKKKSVKSKGRSRKAPKRHDKADAIIALADAGASNAEIAKTTGVSERQVRHVVEEETIRREAETEIDPSTLSMSALKKFEVALRQHKRLLNSEYATRMRAIDEEVKQRVLKEGKEYVERMKGLEEKAWKDEKHWREMVNNHKPPYTVDQFKVILMCLHPDGERTAAKLSEAFKLFNSKKIQLTGEK